MGGRVTALKRILLYLPVLFGNYILFILMGPLAMIYFILDVLFQLITGSQLPGGDFIGALLDWPINNSRFVILGEGELQLTP